MLAYPPAWSCINKICGHVGVLPLNEYERDLTDDRKKVLAEKEAAYWVVKHQPNHLMSPMVFRQTIQGHALWQGNGRAYIKRNQLGEPESLWPLPPQSCSTVLVTIDGRDAEFDDVVNGQRVDKWHLVRTDEGQLIPIHDSNVLHIMGFGGDGLQGYPILDLARDWLGLAKSQNRAIATNFKTGARPGIMLKAPPGVFKTEAEATAWLNGFIERHAGTENDGKVGLLTGGVEAQVLQLSARDSQWQEQRVFSRQDAAIWFQVEQMLGDDSSVSYRSLEEKNRAYLTNCLLRWLTAWEQECWLKLLTKQQQESMRFYFRFVIEGLLRGTAKERYEVYQIARQIRVLSANDVREMEDMDPIEGGDEYENPAIDTQEASTIETPDDDTEQMTNNSERRQLIANRLRAMFKVEAKRVANAITKHAAKIDWWLDSFYHPDEFTARLANVFEEVGGTKFDALEHVAESRKIVAEMAKGGDVTKALDEWPNRADTWANLLT
jgi:HK97 family phage portal protein